MGEIINLSSKRRKLDQYFTPEKATEELINSYGDILSGVILEPCKGTGNIERVLKRNNYVVISNDIDQNMYPDYVSDITKQESWDNIGYVDYTITNPPFYAAPQIVKLAYKNSDKGVFMLLRLSFLEPCLNRAEFLKDHPPTSIIVLPRISFTGDGKTDSVTTAWFCWVKNHESLNNPIKIIGRN